MDKKNNSGGNGFSVFIFGVIIGVLVTLLLTTKKGRKVLKVIIDEGIDKISKWEDVVDTIKTQYEEDNVEDESIVGEVPQIEEKSKREVVRKPILEPDSVKESESTSSVTEISLASTKEQVVDQEDVVVSVTVDEVEVENEEKDEDEDEPPLHAAVLEKKEKEEPLKKKSRLFKGIRRKSS